MKLLHDLSLDELKRELEEIIEKMTRFRAGQIFNWMSDYATFDEMTNIPNELRQTLKEHYIDEPVKIANIFLDLSVIILPESDQSLSKCDSSINKNNFSSSVCSEELWNVFR